MWLNEDSRAWRPFNQTIIKAFDGLPQAELICSPSSQLRFTPDGRPRNARRRPASVRGRLPGSVVPRSGSGCGNGNLAAGSSGSARRPAGECACASPSDPAPARPRARPACRGAGDCGRDPVPLPVSTDAAEHHCDAIGDVLDHREIVRHEQISQVQFALQIFQEIDHLGPDGRRRRAPRPVSLKNLYFLPLESTSDVLHRFCFYDMTLNFLDLTSQDHCQNPLFEMDVVLLILPFRDTCSII